MERYYRNNIDAALGEVLGRLLGGVTGNAAHPELAGELRIIEDGVDDRAALVASGTENSDQVNHDEQ